jgi:hypothetical protein
MFKKLLAKLTAFLNGEKNKNNSPLSMVPNTVVEKLFDQAEVLAEAVDQAVVNVAEEVKKEVENVTAAVKKAPAKKKPAAKKKSAKKT